MPRAVRDMSPNSCVSVSTQVTQRPKSETNALPIGLNRLHESRLITSLCEYYGWVLGDDDNLYNPCPGTAQGESDVA